MRGKEITVVGFDFKGENIGLLAYGIICFVIATRLFRFEQKTA